MRSMTGYGRSEVANEGYIVTVEMKSINNRYKEIVFRMPKALFLFEDKYKNIIGERFKRGRLDVYVTIEKDALLPEIVEVNKQLLAGYLTSIKAIQDQYDYVEKKELSIGDLLRLPNLFEVNRDEKNVEIISQLTERAVINALDELMIFREQEGGQLVKDCLDRVALIEKYCQKIKELAPNMLGEYRDRLEKRIRELLDQNMEIDESRLVVETALYADKVNIDEELTRLASHIEQFRNFVNDSSEEAIGRKLDFLIQEHNREVNTIGSKSNSIEINSIVIEMKSELEKIREQVQNIE